VDLGRKGRERVSCIPTDKESLTQPRTCGEAVPSYEDPCKNVRARVSNEDTLVAANSSKAHSRARYRRSRK